MKQLGGLGLAALVTLMLLPVAAEAGRAKTLSPEWVAALPAAAKTEQLIVVGGMGKTTAWVSMHQKDKKGSWHQVMTTPGFIGKEGDEAYTAGLPDSHRFAGESGEAAP